MKHQSHYSPSEGMWYWVQESRSDTPGGMDGHWEIIRAYHTKDAHRWNMSNMMVGLFKNPAVAEEVARIMALHGAVRAAIPTPLPETEGRSEAV